MEPVPGHEHPHQTHHNSPQQPPTEQQPSLATAHPGKSSSFFSRTSGAFVAEYCVFLIALGLALSNLTWLTYVFFAMIVSAMNGVSAKPTQMFIAWLIVSSIVVLPTAMILWQRIQGELRVNEAFKGEPRGAARGFRTFWIVLSALGMVVMLIAGLYAPVAALLAGSGAPEMLLGVTIPSILGLAITASGIYIATRQPHQAKLAKILLWVVTGLTVVLFLVNFIWAQNSGDRYNPSRYPDYDSYYDY